MVCLPNALYKVSLEPPTSTVMLECICKDRLITYSITQHLVHTQLRDVVLLVLIA